jgi:NAD(P)-dependent dehydrogenase (short-subunit alcohol dehydrogenase family)
MRRMTTLLLFLICTASSASTVLITGSNSGIGYELARQYADEGWHVIATHRRDSIPESLATLSGQYDNVQVETLDVTDMAGIDALAAKLAGQPIDVLVNNAGIVGTFEQPEQKFGTLDYDLFHRFMDTNAAGPLRVAEAFYANVKASEQKKIVAISTPFASLTLVSSDFIKSNVGFSNRYWYNTSKAALNMAFVALASDARADGISVALLSPGLVKVDRTSSYELNEFAQEIAVDVDESARNLRTLIDALSMETTASFQSINRITPW